jgi:hypothetical protein
LSRLPLLRTWPEDGGAFVTLPLVYTEHPDGRGSNLGMYRIQRYGDDTAGLHVQIGKGGGFHLAEYERLGPGDARSRCTSAVRRTDARRRGTAARERARGAARVASARSAGCAARARRERLARVRGRRVLSRRRSAPRRSAIPRARSATTTATTRCSTTTRCCA